MIEEESSSPVGPPAISKARRLLVLDIWSQDGAGTGDWWQGGLSLASLCKGFQALAALGKWTINNLISSSLHLFISSSLHLVIYRAILYTCDLATFILFHLKRSPWCLYCFSGSSFNQRHWSDKSKVLLLYLPTGTTLAFSQSSCHHAFALCSSLPPQYRISCHRPEAKTQTARVRYVTTGQ